MKNSTTPTPKQRIWMVAVLGDYATISFPDLAAAHAALLHDMTAADAYGLVAGRAIRRHCLSRLNDVSAELQRRALPPLSEPQPIRRLPATNRPVAA